MNVRILVADEREANFFDLAKLNSPLQASGSLMNDAGRLHDRDLEADRPGRRFNEGNPGRHATDGERSTRRHLIDQFARSVARSIDGARVRREFDRLVIVAGPRMLGLLREALPQRCRPLVAAEIAKDLVHRDPSEIRDAVPREAFLH